eukprot:375683-Hanusia_phi.AAC.3
MKQGRRRGEEEERNDEEGKGAGKGGERGKEEIGKKRKALYERRTRGGEEDLEQLCDLVSTCLLAGLISSEEGGEC